jgi:hypothetical protein
VTDIVSIALCCNNPDTGMPTGRVCMVDVGSEELLKLESKFGYSDDDMEGMPTLAYDFEVTTRGGFGCDRVTGHVELAGRKFPIIGHKSGWGNWCWDCVIMTPQVAIEFINHLKDTDCFTCTTGDKEFYDIFNEPGVMFSEREIPELQKYGYQRP